MKPLCLMLVAVSLVLGGRHCQSAELTPLSFTTLAGVAGSLVKSVDGTGSSAEFYSPRGVAVDHAGNVYVADSSNHTIRKVTASGAVTTLSGVAGVPGNSDLVPARFSEPFGVAVDAAGTVYVADTNNNAIRKISATGAVTTLAGGNGKGSVDGVGSAAKFMEPHAVAVDVVGNAYVTDYMNHTIRKVTAAGVVTTLAGSPGNSGFADGQGSVARFRSLQGIAVDGAGNVYVADAGNRAIRKVSSSGLVTTLVDGSNGQFGEPRGIAVDAAGIVYFSDYSANAIYAVSVAGAVAKLAGTAPTAGSSDGSANALFNAPSGVAIDVAGNLYVADTLNNTVRKLGAGGVVTTLAGLAGRSSSVDGKGAAARFEDPYAVATDGNDVYVADATDHTIRRIAADGTVTTLAGKAGSFGSSDGSGSAALFRSPQGIAVDAAGTVYVADTGNKTVRMISAAGVVSTLAGSPGQGGYVDAVGSAARFNSPYGVAVDGAGNVHVIDSGDNVLRKITPAGVVTTLAGSPGAIGLADGVGIAARFAVPFDLTVDADGNIYICDHGNHAIRKVTAAGVVTTLAGSGSAGNADGSGRLASFSFPSGITVAASGDVYVADTDNQTIRRISPGGEVSTVGGSGQVGSADGVGTAASFYNPKDVAIDAGGNLFVVDRGNHTIRKGSRQAGTTGATPSSSGQVIEFYNSILDHYFITANAGEAAQIDGGGAGPGWSRTGGSFKSGGSVAVCRFYGSVSPGPNSHFYTVDAGECASLLQIQTDTPAAQKRWNFESLDFVSMPPTSAGAGGACPSGTLPVYRAYNNGFARGLDSNHRITTSRSAIQEVVARGWSDEGVAMCAPN